MLKWEEVVPGKRWETRHQAYKFTLCRAPIEGYPLTIDGPNQSRVQFEYPTHLEENPFQSFQAHLRREAEGIVSLIDCGWEVREEETYKPPHNTRYSVLVKRLPRGTIYVYYQTDNIQPWSAGLRADWQEWTQEVVMGGSATEAAVKLDTWLHMMQSGASVDDRLLRKYRNKPLGLEEARALKKELVRRKLLPLSVQRNEGYWLLQLLNLYAATH